MATRDVTPLAVPKTYAELRAAVILTIVKGQQAYEIARVRTYHETGRLIHEHVLLFKQRADHGARPIARLSAEVKLHRSVLQRCVQFYQAMPNCAKAEKTSRLDSRLRLSAGSAVRNPGVFLLRRNAGSAGRIWGR